jgi:hypothetical protein
MMKLSQKYLVVEDPYCLERSYVRNRKIKQYAIPDLRYGFPLGVTPPVLQLRSCRNIACRHSGEGPGGDVPLPAKTFWNNHDRGDKHDQIGNQDSAKLQEI